MFRHNLIAGSFVLLWQYIGIRFPSLVRPSEFIDMMTTGSKLIFGSIGSGIAYLSSFYVILKLNKFFKAITQLGYSGWLLFLSVLELFQGYGIVAATYDNPGLVGFGSLTLIGLLIYLVSRYFQLDMAWVERHTYTLGLIIYQFTLMVAMGLSHLGDLMSWQKELVSFTIMSAIGWITWYFRHQIEHFFNQLEKRKLAK